MQTAAMILTALLVAGLIVAGCLYLGERYMQAAAQASDAQSSRLWAQAGVIQAQEHLENTRSENWRRDLMTFATIMKLSGTDDLLYMFIGAVAGVLGTLLFQRIVGGQLDKIEGRSVGTPPLAGYRFRQGGSDD